MSIIFWVFYPLLALFVGMYASGKGRSFFLFFILSLIFSPLLGFIIALIVKDEKKANKQHKEMLEAIQSNKKDTKNEDEFSSIKQVDSNKVLIAGIGKKTFDKIIHLLDGELLSLGFEKLANVANNVSYEKENEKINVELFFAKKEISLSCTDTKIPNVINELMNPVDNANNSSNESIDVSEQLTKLANLLEKGLLTQEEFDSQKLAILAKA